MTGTSWIPHDWRIREQVTSCLTLRDNAKIYLSSHCPPATLPCLDICLRVLSCYTHCVAPLLFLLVHEVHLMLLCSHFRSFTHFPQCKGTQALRLSVLLHRCALHLERLQNKMRDEVGHPESDLDCLRALITDCEESSCWGEIVLWDAENIKTYVVQWKNVPGNFAGSQWRGFWKMNFGHRLAPSTACNLINAICFLSSTWRPTRLHTYAWKSYKKKGDNQA